MLGPLVREQIEAGIKAGSEKERQEGRQEALRQLAEKRYGPLPAWAEARIAAGSAENIKEWSLALYDTNSLELLLRSKI